MYGSMLGMLSIVEEVKVGISIMGGIYVEANARKVYSA